MLKRLLISKETLIGIQSLKADIKKLVVIIPSLTRKSIKSLTFLGLLTSYSLESKSQDIILDEPIYLDTSTNYHRLDYVGLDTTDRGMYNLFSDVATTARFIDIDNDGDLDAFYMISDEGCGGSFCPTFLPAYNRLIFQENISTIFPLYNAPELILIQPSYVHPLPFELSDFDQDGDYDLLISDYNLFSSTSSRLIAYENLSSQTDSFNFNQAIYYTVPNFSADYTCLADADQDGDLDLINSIPSLNNISFQYLENNGTSTVFPFDTAWQYMGIDLVVDTMSRLSKMAATFVDIDEDGTTDLLVQAYFEEDDLDSFYYEIEKRLVYYKNNTSSGFLFNSPGEQIAERDIFVDTYFGEQYYTYFNTEDFDGDGDFDIIENLSNSYQICGYCSKYYSMRGIYYRENIAKTATGIQESNQLLAVTIIGNPSNQYVSVEFDNKSLQNVSLVLYDITGKLVYTSETSDNEFTIYKNELATGLYSFIIQVGDRFGNGKFVFE